MAISTSIASTPCHVGDLIRLHLKVVEGDKERIQVFEGLLMGIGGRGENETFTVRKIAANNVAVERIFPTNSPWIAKVEVKRTGSVRRAKLNYIRKQSSRQVAAITQIKS